MTKLLNPPLRKTSFTKGTIIAAVLGTMVVGGYSYAAITQWAPDPAERDELPASVRSSPGGYRSYAFWHVGYHGGK